jgi:hypothetical protein
MQGDDFTKDNSFNGNKLPRQGFSNTTHDVAAVDPYKLAEQMRVMPRQLSTGAQRGEMTIFGKLTVGDPNSDERIVIGGDSNQFGIFGGVSSGGDSINRAWSITQQQFNFYRLDQNGRNNMRIGQLPDGTYNMVAVKDGYEVEDAF